MNLKERVAVIVRELQHKQRVHQELSRTASDHDLNLIAQAMAVAYGDCLKSFRSVSREVNKSVLSGRS